MNQNNQNSNYDEIMTLTEVAEYLKISEVTTYKMMQSGKIPGFKIGRSWRIKREDLNNHIDTLKERK